MNCLFPLYRITTYRFISSLANRGISFVYNNPDGFTYARMLTSVSPMFCF